MLKLFAICFVIVAVVEGRNLNGNDMEQVERAIEDALKKRSHNDDEDSGLPS
jgi:hypothetical protein